MERVAGWYSKLTGEDGCAAKYPPNTSCSIALLMNEEPRWGSVWQNDKKFVSEAEFQPSPFMERMPDLIRWVRKYIQNCPIH
jgi:hypothetical protein